MAPDHSDQARAPGGQAPSCQVWPIVQIRDRFKNPDPGFLGNEWTTVNDPGDRLIGDTTASGYIVESSIFRLSPDAPGERVSLPPWPSYGAIWRSGTRSTRSEPWFHWVILFT
jgi:hypothetical protein